MRITPTAWLWPSAWLVACLVAIALGRGWTIDGDLERLVPTAHRSSERPSALLLWRSIPTPDRPGELRMMGDTVREALGEAWVPLGPPPGDLDVWMNAHLMLLLPPAADERLRERWTEAAISQRIADLRARMSSPLFGLDGLRERRDPLGLEELWAVAGPAPRTETSRGARVVGPGDLLDRSGSTMLLGLRPEFEDAIRDASTLARAEGFEVALVGPPEDLAQTRARLRSLGADVVAVFVAGLVAALALYRRAILLPVGQALVVVATTAAAASWADVSPESVPMLSWLAAWTTVWIASSRPVAPIAWGLSSLALLPLIVTPYPGWVSWAWIWMATVAVGGSLARRGLATITGTPSGDTPPGATPTSTRRFPRWLRTIAIAGPIAAGVAAVVAGPRTDELALDLGPSGAPRERLSEHFFEPDRFVRTWTIGRDRTSALETASLEVGSLSSAREEVAAIDGPALLILPEAVVADRLETLRRLHLDERLSYLRSELTRHGLHAEAFAEFLDHAVPSEPGPTAQAALRGPLARWIERYVREDGTDVRVATEVELRPDADVSRLRERVPSLQGPSIARGELGSASLAWCVAAVVGQIVLGAGLVAVSARRWRPAARGAAVALATVGLVFAGLWGLSIPYTPVLLPVVLAAATLAMIRSVLASVTPPDRGSETLLVGVGLACAWSLISSGVPAWVAFGWTVALGTVAASSISAIVGAPERA